MVRIISSLTQLAGPGRVAVLVALGVGSLSPLGPSPGRAWAAETIVLENGSELVGEVVTEGVGGDVPYVVRVEGGATVTLPVDQVKRVVRADPLREEYRQRLAGLTDTAEAHWELAEWCRSQQLDQEREGHLRQVLRLDPNHSAARHAAGFVQRNGEWVRPDDWMTSQGFVYFRGRWRSPLDVAMIERAEQREKGVKQWRRDIRRALEGRGRGDLEQQLAGVDDPLAIEALALELTSRRNAAQRQLLVNLLGPYNTPVSNRGLVQAAIFDPDIEVRDRALDWLDRHRPRDMTGVVITGLKHRDNAVVNRAASVLAHLGDPAAIPYLIPALTTVHRIVNPPSPGIQAGFGRRADGSPGGMGLSMGERPKSRDVPVNNKSVLSALRSITGADFDYDQSAWWDWYITATTPTSVNLRRSR